VVGGLAASVAVAVAVGMLAVLTKRNPVCLA
jgi:hypothetical protein